MKRNAHTDGHHWMKLGGLAWWGGASLALALAFPAFAARTVSSDYMLSGDEDWRGDGVVTVEEGVNVDLNGHVLYLAGLAGKGSFTASENASFTDLTVSGSATLTVNGTEVESAGSGKYPASQAFDNNLATIIYYRSFSTQFEINYDFGSSTYVNCYKLYVGARSDYPTAWTFQGLDSDSNWIDLDSRTGQTFSSSEWNSYTFFPTSGASYSKFRLKVTAVKGNNSNLSLTEMQIGILKNQIRIDSSQSAGFAAASNTVDSAIDCVLTGGRLPADIDLRGLNRKITLDGDLDLNGYALKVVALDGSGAVSSTSDVPAGTDGKTSLTGSGTYSACKAGSGADVSDSFAASNPLSNAFDNKLSTSAMISGSNGYVLALDYNFHTATLVNRYAITVASDSTSKKRAPRKWKIYGSNDASDASSWSELDSKSVAVNKDGEVPYTSITNSFENTTAYQYYRFYFDEAGNAISGKHGDRKQLCEIQYFYKGDGNCILVENEGLAESDLSNITTSGSVEILNTGDFELSETTDWSNLGPLALTGTIDLAGHDLTVSKLTGSGTVTDSSTSATGTLHVVVASGKTVANTTVSLTGNLKLSKEGAGTLTATKAAQTYAGGTEVVAGTLGCGNTGANSPFGTGVVTVDAGGVLEMNGKGGHNITPIVLNGGTLQNSTSVTSAGSNELGLLTLTADSTFNCANHTWFGATGDSGLSPCIDLGGYTLTVDLNSSKTLRLRNVAITNGGTLDVINGGRILVIGDGVTAPTVTLKAQCAVLIDSGASMSVKDYESLYASDYDAATYTGPLSVYGTFIPTTRYFLGCTLMDGATLDLSALSDTLSISSLATTAGQTELSFADDATIYVNVGSRSLTSSSCLLSWTEETKPSNLSSLKFVRPDDTRIYRISVQSGGLYYAGAGLMIIFR